LIKQNWVNTIYYFISFLLLPPIAFVITSVISNNLALSLGMIGALSIVRFRNPVKNPLELVIFFGLITIGISFGVNPKWGVLLTTIIVSVLISSRIFQIIAQKYDKINNLLKDEISSLNKTIAEKHGLRATFMPKPFENLTGNGCHAHISVWDGKKNKFLDNSNKLGLSKMAYNFLGGVIKNASSLSAFFNPTINSYRRINAPPTKSGATWSPSSISYTGNNRTHMIRIPDQGRFELRLMDGSANPYLLQAGIIAAGLEGINKKLNPGKPLHCNMYKDYKKYPKLKKLPNDINQAISMLQKSKSLANAFGKDVIESYIKLKNLEIKDFKNKSSFNKKKPVTKWEKDNTLDC